MTNVYSEFHFYSPKNDRMEVRVSMADAHNREFWMSIPEGEGKRYRERRDDALDAIQTAIEQGLQPGRVVIK